MRGGDAALFILDPVALNKMSGLSGVKHVPDDKDFDYQSVYWNKKPFAAQHPIAIEAPFQNPRIMAQRGVFTVQGDDPEPVETQCPEAVRKVILPAGARGGVMEFLNDANLNQYTIYPNIFGMAQHIVSRAFGEG